MRIGVILLAAGSGTRMGIPGPKQFLGINGRPILELALQAFLDWGKASQVVVTLPAARMADGEALLRKAFPDAIGTHVTLVPGGSSRHRSIRAALESLHGKCEIVIVHDAVRPFVDPDVLDRLVTAAQQSGAAGASMPLVDTVLRVDGDGRVVETLNRAELVASQTPQAFDMRLLERAYATASDLDLELGTECLELARKVGAQATVVEGSASLFKVTYPPDLGAAQKVDMRRRRQVAIVSGSTRGIGREIARQMADHGMKVVVVGRDSARCHAVATEIGGLAWPGDVSQPATARSVVAATLQRFGRLDVLVNNAGVGHLLDVERTTDEDWNHIVGTNLSGSFYLAREAFRAMRSSGRGGVIITIGSSSIDKGRPGLAAYAASKAGAVLLAETLAIEGRPYGIHSFAVVPRGTDTDLRRQLYPDAHEEDLLDPSEVARMVLFCVEEWMPHLSGQVIWVR